MTKFLLAALVLVTLYACSNNENKSSQMTDAANQQFGDSKIDSTDLKLLKDSFKDFSFKEMHRVIDSVDLNLNNYIQKDGSIRQDDLMKFIDVILGKDNSVIAPVMKQFASDTALANNLYFNDPEKCEETKYKLTQIVASCQDKINKKAYKIISSAKRCDFN